MPVTSNKNGRSKAGISTPAALVMLVAGLVAGFAAGKFVASPKAVNAPATAGTYDAGYADAKTRLEKLSVIAPEPDHLTELSGNVLEVKESSFAMHVDVSVLNPLVKGVPEVRDVRVTKDTVLTIKVKRDDAAFKRDMEAYDKALSAAVAAGKAIPAAPPQFEFKKISLADMRANDHVIVTADYDVKYEASFDAVSVEVGYEARTFVPEPIPESRPPAPADNRPPPPKEGEAPPPLPPMP